LGRDGTVKGEANVPAYTRSSVATKEGPLRFRHGSVAPASTVNTPAEVTALKEQTPGKALDEVANLFGARIQGGFEEMANSTAFFNPSADYWGGKCHAWTWASLSSTIDKLVDVPGPEGERGLWIAGKFLSRADLGNWMMATADMTIAGLPTKETDDVPEYFWKPTMQALEDTLAGRQNDVVDRNPYGEEFKFFVGKVLKNGVPATTRTAFEKELAALPAGAIDSIKAGELAAKYPTVANAYSPFQWQRAFASRGLGARAFGVAF